jgi:hypothetical protein
MSQPRIPSVERGCVGKINLGRRYKQRAEKFAAEYRTRFGVYRCPHCQAYHLTRKVENADEYGGLLHVTEDHRMPTNRTLPNL